MVHSHTTRHSRQIRSPYVFADESREISAWDPFSYWRLLFLMQFSVSLHNNFYGSTVFSHQTSEVAKLFHFSRFCPLTFILIGLPSTCDILITLVFFCNCPVQLENVVKFEVASLPSLSLPSFPLPLFSLGWSTWCLWWQDSYLTFYTRSCSYGIPKDEFRYRSDRGL